MQKRSGWMGRLILVTGGARSGKSSFAEERARNFGVSILYIATAIGMDEEMNERIRRHRLQRPAGWETHEAFCDFEVSLPGLLKGRDAVLLDCVTVMVFSAFLLTKLLGSKLGGVTGDILGAVCELNQVVFLLAAYLLVKFV